jgi:hypothetical protein
MMAISFLSEQKRFLQTGLVVLGTIGVFLFFPPDTHLDLTVQFTILSFAFFFLIPVLYVKFIAREPLSALGFQGNRGRFGFMMIPLTVVPMLLAWYVFLRAYPAGGAYKLPVAVGVSFPFFVVYEVVLMGALTFLYEVFFRGTIQLLWLRKAGLRAATWQAVIFLIFIAVTDGVTWRSLPLVLSTIVAGIVAQYTRSIYYSFAAAWIFLFLCDVFLLLQR